MIAQCAVCGEPFNRAEWDERHSDTDGEDIHAMCCVQCVVQGELTFDGADYDHRRDAPRLTSQIKRIWFTMLDEQWRSLETISFLTGDPAASVSAQLRHMRKPKFGGHTIERSYQGDGLYHYRLIPNPDWPVLEPLVEPTNEGEDRDDQDD